MNVSYRKMLSISQAFMIEEDKTHGRVDPMVRIRGYHDFEKETLLRIRDIESRLTKKERS